MLRLGSAGLIAGTLGAPGAGPRPARGATPKSGGTLRFRGYDPPTFDLHLRGGHAYKTQIVYSFTHSRLLRHKTGPG